MQIHPIANHATLPDMPSATNTDHDGRYQLKGDVLDDLNALGANPFSGDPANDFLVGTAAGTLAWQSGATARTSIGLGTTDLVQFLNYTATAGGTDHFTFAGYNSGVGNIGSSVSACGFSAARLNEGDDGSGLGAYALYGNKANKVSGFGQNAFHSNTGANCSGGGYNVGHSNTGANCLFWGYGAGQGNATANLFILAQTNVNATPLLQGDFSSGQITIGEWAATDIAVLHGGTGASTAGDARDNLGLGTMATQNANLVAITGGEIDGTEIGRTTPSIGHFTEAHVTTGLVFDFAATQKYQFTGLSNRCDLQGLAAATSAHLALFTQDGASNQVLSLFNVGTPGSITNRERLQFRALTGAPAEIRTEADGTGVLQNLIIYTEGATNQLYLQKTTGRIGVNRIPTGFMLEVEGAIKAVGATAGDLIADDNVQAVGNVISSAGSIVATIGNVTAGNDVIAGDSVFVSLGAVGTPSFTFTGNPNTGMWSSGANIIDFSAGGQIVLELDTAGLRFSPGTKTDGFVYRLVSEVQTTDATVTTVDSITLLDENAYHLEAYVIGVRSTAVAGSDRASYHISSTIYRTAAGGATIESQTVVHVGESNAAWDATFTVNGNDARVSITGEAAVNVEWTCLLKYINMSN